MLVKLQTDKCKSAAILYISMHVPLLTLTPVRESCVEEVKNSCTAWPHWYYSWLLPSKQCERKQSGRELRVDCPKSDLNQFSFEQYFNTYWSSREEGKGLDLLSNSLTQFSKKCMEVSQDNLHVDIGSYRVKQTFFLGQAGNLALKKPGGLNWAKLTFTNTSWIAGENSWHFNGDTTTGFATK